jgi:hypothetical protein
VTAVLKWLARWLGVEMLTAAFKWAMQKLTEWQRR